eukprot:Rmarinus@m.4385
MRLALSTARGACSLMAMMISLKYQVPPFRTSNLRMRSQCPSGRSSKALVKILPRYSLVMMMELLPCVCTCPGMETFSSWLATSMKTRTTQCTGLGTVAASAPTGTTGPLCMTGSKTCSGCTRMELLLRYRREPRKTLELWMPSTLGFRLTPSTGCLTSLLCFLRH